MRWVFTIALLAIACDDDPIPDVGERDAGASMLPEAPRPPDPTFPETVGTLTVTLRTASAEGAETDDPIEICLRSDRCMALTYRHEDPFERGQTDVFHVPLDLARSEVTEVRLRGGDDVWRPECMELRFDGEPVYCNDAIDAELGEWSDPEGLHQTCTTCQRGMLTHGPMQGVHESTRARVWVRADASRHVGLRMSETGNVEAGPIVAWAIPRPEDDFTATLEVDGLEAGRDYLYRIEIGDELGETHALRTAPPDDASVDLAFGSCSLRLGQPIFANILDAQPDAFVFLGDAHYGDAAYLESHRWRFRRFRNVPERAALFAETPILATWDDHDFTGNNSDVTCLGVEDALRAWREWWASPSYGTEDTRGVFFRRRYGAADVFMLDCRTHRPFIDDPRRFCLDDPDAVSTPIEDGILGPGQEAWLLDGLNESDAPFKLLVCGSQWTTQGTLDSWASFVPARDRLFDRIDAAGIEGVVLVSGDIHRSSIRRIARPRYDLIELTTSPLAADRGECGTDDELVACWDDTDSYLWIHADPDTLRAEIRDTDGTARHAIDLAASALR